MCKFEYLDDVRKGLRESVDFFASRDSFLRERYVVSEFLENLGLRHEENDLVRGGDPPDIIFRDVQFEVKEIMDDGRTRLREYEEALASAEAADDPADLLKEFTPREISIEEIFREVLARASWLAARKYTAPAFRRSLDLLYYVNLRDTMGLVEEPYPDVAALESLHFRSVSFLIGHRSGVFCAEEDAPAFLRSNIGITHRVYPTD